MGEWMREDLIGAMADGIFNRLRFIKNNHVPL
jgi:hypothetical protein